MLKSFTAARIALGRVGSSLPTQEILDFGCAHALARDAVHRPLDVGALDAQLQLQGFRTLQVNSQASGRDEYLLRPDLGRRLSIEACAALSEPTLPQDYYSLSVMVCHRWPLSGTSCRFWLKSSNSRQAIGAWTPWSSPRKRGSRSVMKSAHCCKPKWF
jgi:ethanolamine ammonia-lyase small subunit